ncbi:MAG: TIGR02147 family protein [Proteobacteria bacterium]|nr:MAG: TIGR02147 family protein [Pseudomonadota bacterium]
MKTNAKIEETHELVTYLKTEFIKRKKKNAGYSVRAFAKALGTSHVNLSLILRGQRPVTSKFVASATSTLGCGPELTNRFLRTLQTVPKTPDTDTQFQQLTSDTYDLMSNWYYDGILEFVRIPGVSIDARSISTAFNIHVFEAEKGLEVLLRLKLLTKDSKGRIKPDSPDTTTNIRPELTSAALRNCQKEILNKSLNAIDEDPISIRDHTSVTLAFESSQMPEIKRLIAEFRHRISAVTQNSARSADSIYQLSVGFFPLATALKIKTLKLKNLNPEDQRSL